jgi:hypothetical protein
VKINSRALDPTGPMYQTPSPHQGFGGNPFLEEGDYNRGPGGHSPGHGMRDGEPYRRDSLGGPGHIEREMMQQQQQFNMKGPSGYPMSMRGKEPFRNPNSPYPADNNRINIQQQQLGHGHYSSNDLDPMAMRRQSHLQLQVQQFHQQNTRLSVPQGHSPGMSSPLPLTPAMAPSHPYRERERDPRLRAVSGAQPLGPGGLMKRQGPEWNPVGTMSLDRPRDMAGGHFGPSTLKADPSPYNASMYGSNFNSQRTSLESNSDYSNNNYLNPSGNNFLSQDTGDFGRKDHLPGGKTPISRSFSGYAQPSMGDIPKPSRSFTGYSADTIIVGDQNAPYGAPKNEPYGQFMGFGAIGSAPPLTGPGQGVNQGQGPRGMYERGPDSFSSEASTTEDGIEGMRDPHGQHHLRPQYRDKDGGQGQGQGQGQSQQIQGHDQYHRNSGTSGEASNYRDQFNDGIRASVSRSSSFGSTLDSLNSYKHISLGPGPGPGPGGPLEEDHPVRRGGFVLPNPYAPNSGGPPPGNLPYQMQQKPFDIRRGNPNTNVSVSLQDVRECLEEDNSNDLTSHDAHSPTTIKLHESGTAYHMSHTASREYSSTQSPGSHDVGGGGGGVYGAMTGTSMSITHTHPGGAVEGSESSNMDSYRAGFQGMGGSNSNNNSHSRNDNSTSAFNNINSGIVNNDAVLDIDESSNYLGNIDKYHYDGAFTSSDPVSSLSSPQIHFGSPGAGGGSNTSAGLMGGERERERDGQATDLSDFENIGNKGMGMSISSCFRGVSTPLEAKVVGSEGGLGSLSGSGNGVGGLTPEGEGEGKEDDDERMPFSRRPSSALSEPTADYLQDDFTLLTTDTHTFIPLDKWMIKVWLHIVFSGFDSDIIEGFITKLRDDGGFVTVQVCSVRLSVSVSVCVCVCVCVLPLNMCVPVCVLDVVSSCPPLLILIHIVAHSDHSFLLLFSSICLPLSLSLSPLLTIPSFSPSPPSLSLRTSSMLKQGAS